MKLHYKAPDERWAACGSTLRVRTTPTPDSVTCFLCLDAIKRRDLRERATPREFNPERVGEETS